MKKTVSNNIQPVVNNEEHIPYRSFKKTFLFSNILVIAVMIGVTVLIDHMHQVMAMADKKPEVVKVLKVAAIGDSITFGAAIDNKNIEQNSYPTRLQELLGKNYDVTNYGIGGRTLLSTGNLPYAKEAEYQTSHTTNPDIILIMLGTNDSRPMNWNADAYRNELTDFTNSYKNLSNKPKVYLMTIPPVSNIPGDDVESDFSRAIATNETVPIIKQVAEATNVSVIDIYGAMKDHLDLFYDGVHPTPEGYKLIAKTVYNAIK